VADDDKKASGPRVGEGVEPSKVREEIRGLLQPPDTERALGFNEGLNKAVAILDRHEEDRRRLSARAIKRRKVEGKKIGGDVPYGYELGSDGETLQLSTSEQRVIATARKLQASYSLREVARRLKARGMFPREKQRNDEFHAAQIKRMTDETNEKK
jgi:hypothetical protein